MEYERKYQNRINWQNTPSTSTPLNATNLNKMDVALQYMDEKLKEAVDSGIATPNPSGAATENLTKLGIGNTIYNIAGGSSYTAGAGINIDNGAIINTQTGARCGKIDSISSSRAHAEILLNTNETFDNDELIVLRSLTSGTADVLRIQYASAASSVYDFNVYDTSGTASTITLTTNTALLIQLNATFHRAVVLANIDLSGGGSTTLSGLTDTDITNPSDGQVLKYNSTAQKWENNTDSNTTTLAGLTDTSISSPSNGQVLKYNSTSGKWENENENTISKTRYKINSSSWSSSQDVAGLYTYTLALNPTLVGSVNVYVAGSYDDIYPTDANKTNYSYVKRCNLNTSNLILRAYPKPDANFYIWVEGVEGTNGSGTSYQTVGNVIQPNGSEGSSFVTGSETLTFSTSEWSQWGTLYYADKYIVANTNVKNKKVFISLQATLSEIGLMASVHITPNTRDWVPDNQFEVRFIRPTIPPDQSTTTVNYMITD